MAPAVGRLFGGSALVVAPASGPSLGAGPIAHTDSGTASTYLCLFACRSLKQNVTARRSPSEPRNSKGLHAIFVVHTDSDGLRCGPDGAEERQQGSHVV